MTGLHLLAITPIFAAGAVVACCFMPLVHRAGREAERRDKADVAWIRGAFDALASLTAAPPRRLWAGPRALWHRAARLRLDRLFDGVWAEPIRLARIPLLELAPVSVPPVRRVPIGAEPAPVELVSGTPVRTVLLAEATPEPQPGEPDHPDYPWTIYPLEPGLGNHDEDEPPAGRHSVADPLGDTAEWLDLVARLQAMGAVEVDPLALPCSRCETDHVGCVGCACPCTLAEVTR